MRTWFITGASRGLGLLFVENALSIGDNVIATARSISSLTDKFGGLPNFYVTPLDVTNKDQAIEAVNAGISRFGNIDVLINNAGFGLLGAVEESSDSESREVFDTNVFGLLNVTRAILPHMRERRSGKIINISSIAGIEAAAGWGVYSATKFAVEGITEALHKELSPLGINVTVIQPGYFRTDFLDQASLKRTAINIADYDDTVGVVKKRATDLNHSQPGDPSKLVSAVMHLIENTNPPVRLALGSDTVERTESKIRATEENLLRWKEISVSTNFIG